MHIVRTQSHIKAAHRTTIFSTHMDIDSWVLVLAECFNLRFLLCPGPVSQGCNRDACQTICSYTSKFCCHPDTEAVQLGR